MSRLQQSLGKRQGRIPEFLRRKVQQLMLKHGLAGWNGIFLYYYKKKPDGSDKILKIFKIKIYSTKFTLTTFMIWHDINTLAIF